MSVTDEQMLSFAMKFECGWQGHTVTVERYTNHGQLLPDGQWAVVRHLFSRGSLITNPLYLNGSSWLYKNGQTWPSWREAIEHMLQYASRPGTRGWNGEKERPHERDEIELANEEQAKLDAEGESG